jgi:hypothetical protein
MTTRRVESFLLRIVVPEEKAQSPERWRGRIQHVTTGVEQQIDELAEAISFITAHLGAGCDVTVEVEEIVPAPAPR